MDILFFLQIFLQSGPLISVYQANIQPRDTFQPSFYPSPIGLTHDSAISQLNLEVRWSIFIFIWVLLMFFQLVCLVPIGLTHNSILFFFFGVSVGQTLFSYGNCLCFFKMPVWPLQVMFIFHISVFFIYFTTRERFLFFLFFFSGQQPVPIHLKEFLFFQNLSLVTFYRAFL